MGDQMDLMWKVPYTPGTLTAKGIKNGKVVCEKVIVTAGKPSKIELLVDNDTVNANGQDVVHVEVNVLDEDNNFVPDALNKIRFTVTGEATILAVDNGDPKSEESFVGDTRKSFNGKCIIIVKTTKKAGEFTISAESEELENATVTAKSI